MRLPGRRAPRSDDEEFEGAVREACQRLGLTVLAYAPDVVQVQGRITGAVALSDLRASCALQPRRRWTGVVLDALQGLATSLEAALDLTDADTARPRLRARVYTEGALLAEEAVRRPLAPGLVEVLVADVGGAVRLLPPEVVGAWDEDLTDLWDLARSQVLDAGDAACRQLDLGGVEVTALETPSPYAATHVHALPVHLDVPPEGALVALPTRHLLLAAPLRARAQVLDAAQALLVNAAALERHGPGGLSPDLWWWRAGRLVPLPGTPTSLSPPPEFVEVLDALPG